MLEPRPHSGEPLALDLLNTCWPAARQHDWLSTEEGLQAWLTERGLEAPPDPEAARLELTALRERVLDYLQTGSDASRQAIDAVLERGRLRRSLTALGPATLPEVAPQSRAAWLAAQNLLELLEADPKRIKRCANPECSIVYYDTSPKNARRWHDMKTCGNRLKARRHHQKLRAGGERRDA